LQKINSRRKCVTFLGTKTRAVPLTIKARSGRIQLERKEFIKMTTYIPPYVSAGEFIKFINVLSRRKPDTLTVKLLQEIGISESNSYTLKGSLVRMGIYDEDGKLSQRADLIGLSSKDQNEKREAFKRILERTYPDLLQAVPLEVATVDKVRHYFEINHAAPGPALKGARLFIWLADQAGFQTAEDEFTPYNLEQEKSPKQRSMKKKARPSGSGNYQSQEEPRVSVLRTPEEEEDRLLDALQEKIRTTQGFPPLELVKTVQELIASKKARSHQKINAPETSASAESSNT
jgi:hypothetical protein